MSDQENKNNANKANGADSKPKARRQLVPKKDKPPLPARVSVWMRKMKSEMKKVVWPTPKQVLNNSLIVAVAVIVIGAVIAVYDFGASQLLTAIIRLALGSASGV